MSAPASSLPLPTNHEQLQTVLTMLLAPDTTAIKQATEIMKQFMKNQASVNLLMYQIKASTQEEARQMAAVLLRRKISNHWSKLNAAEQTEIKNDLLARLQHEQSRPVRRAVAALISSVAKLTIPKKKWPELLPFLDQCSQAPDASHREIAMLLFRALAENIEHLKSMYLPLQTVFQRGMKDSNESVRIGALYGIGTLVELIGDDQSLASFKKVIPDIVTLVKTHIQSNDEDVIQAAFEVFDILADSSQPVLDDHIPSICQMMVEVAVNPHFDISIREKASMFISSVIEAKPNKITRANLVEPILRASMMMCCEAHEEVFEANEMTPQKIGVEILDAILLNIPKRLVYQPTLNHASELLKSADKHARKGGFVILAVMAEGCAEQMLDTLEPLVDAVCAGMRDSESLVRSAALVAITQFADHLNPEVITYHAKILPGVFAALDNPNEPVSVKERACISLDVLCEHLEGDILPYIDQMMTKLIQLLQSGQQSVAESALSAIKSIASAAGASFLPYFPTTINLVGTLLSNTSDELLKLRCRATECVGYMAAAVGKDAFKPFLNDCLNVIMSGMELDFFELRESSYICFGKFAEMLGAEFAPLLQTIVPYIIATCQSDDGVSVTKAGDGLEADYGDDDEYADDEDNDEDLEEEYRKLNFSIRSGALDEKVAAISCMATIMSVVGSAFLPYVEKCYQSLDELSEYPHHFIRHAVVNAECEMLTLFNTIFPPPQPAQTGVATPLHPETKKITDLIVPLLLLRLEEEDDRETTASACDALSEACKLFGMTVIQPHLPKLYKAITTLLKEKAPCQRPSDDEDAQEIADHDEILIDSVTDLISILGSTLGPAFEPAPGFKTFFPLLLKFADSKRPPTDRSMAIGCIAEVAVELGPSMHSYIPTLIPLLHRSLADPAVSVRRNAAFCVGTVCLTGDRATVPELEKFLNGLHKLYTPSELDEQKSSKDDSEWLACRDNACSAMAKIITAATSNPELNATFPLAQVLPVFLQGLPLQNDFLESKHCYNTILTLYRTHANVIGPHTPQVISIFAQVFGNPEVDATVQREIVEFCKAFAASPMGPQLQQVVAALPQQQAENFMRFLNAP